MRYQNEELGASFEIADRFTVREQLAFRSALVGARGQSAYVRYWSAAPSVITNWSCDLIPDPTAVDLDATDDVRIAEVIVWTADTVAGHMTGLETPPKK